MSSKVVGELKQAEAAYKTYDAALKTGTPKVLVANKKIRLPFLKDAYVVDQKTNAVARFVLTILEKLGFYHAASSTELQALKARNFKIFQSAEKLANSNLGSQSLAHQNAVRADAAAQKNAALAERNGSLKNRLFQTKSDLRDARGEEENFRTRAALANARNETLERRKQKLESFIERAERRNNLLAQNLRDAEQKGAQSRNAVKALEQQVKELRRAAGPVVCDMGMAEALEKAERLQREQAAQIVDLNDELGRLKPQMEQLVHEYNNRLAEGKQAASERDEALALVDTLQAKLSHAERLQEATQKGAAEQQQLASERGAALEDLRAQLSEARKDLEGKQAALSKAESKLDAQDRTSKDLTDRLASVKAQLEMLVAAYNDKLAEGKKALAERDQALARVDERGHELRIARDELALARGAHEAERERANHFEGRFEEASQLQRRTKEELAAAQSLIRQFQKEQKKVQRQLDSALDSAKKAASDLKAAKSKAEREYAELNAQYTHAQAELEGMELWKEEAEKRVEDVRQGAVRHKKDAQALRLDLANREEQISILQDRLQQAEQVRDAADREATRLRQAYSELNAEKGKRSYAEVAAELEMANMELAHLKETTIPNLIKAIREAKKK